MRPLTLSAALAAALALPAHADMVLIQQGPMPATLPAPQVSAFGMAEAFIRDNVATRMPPGTAAAMFHQGVPHAPPVLFEEPRDSDPISFAGAWRLSEILDDTGRPMAFDPSLLAATEFNVDLGGAFSAFAGCNRIFGEVEMLDGVVSSVEYGMTMMACLGPVGELERAMTRLLDSAALVALGPEILVLLDADGDKLAEFELLFEAP